MTADAVMFRVCPYSCRKKKVHFFGLKHINAPEMLSTAIGVIKLQKSIQNHS